MGTIFSAVAGVQAPHHGGSACCASESCEAGGGEDSIDHPVVIRSCDGTESHRPLECKNCKLIDGKMLGSESSTSVKTVGTDPEEFSDYFYLTALLMLEGRASKCCFEGPPRAAADGATHTGRDTLRWHCLLNL